MENMENEEERDGGLGLNDAIFAFSGLSGATATGVVTKRLFGQLCVLLMEKGIVTKAELSEKVNILRSLHTERDIADGQSEVNDKQVEMLNNFKAEITEGFDQFLLFINDPDAD